MRKKKAYIIAGIALIISIAFILYIGNYPRWRSSPADTGMILSLRPDEVRLVKQGQVQQGQLSQDMRYPSHLSYVGWFSFGPKIFSYIKSELDDSKRLYSLKDTVDGYIITAIKKDSLVLSRGEKKYILPLVADADKGEEVVTVISDNERIVHLSVLLSKINNINELANRVLLFPHLDKGRIKGMEVHHLVRDELTRPSGILKGDIICSVNGKKITSFQDVCKLYEDVRIKDVFEVLLERDGRDIALIYNLVR